MKPALTNGRITGWFCPIHNSYNDILNVNCSYCKSDKTTTERTCERPFELTQLAAIELFNRGILLQFNLPILEPNNMPADFSALFVEHRARVRDMSDEELIKLREEASDIAHKARIMLLAADEETRERKAKNKNWSVPASESNIGDVEQRAKRMSKAEKQAKLMKDLGIKNADEILASLGKGTMTPTVKIDLNSIEIKPKTTFNADSLSGLFKAKQV